MSKTLIVLVSAVSTRRHLRSAGQGDLIVLQIWTGEDTSAARSAIPSDNHRPSLVSCCSIHRLELIVCLPPVFTISLHVSTTAKDTSLSVIIPRQRHLTSLHYAPVDFVVAICHFSHVKKHWLIDWLLASVHGAYQSLVR